MCERRRDAVGPEGIGGGAWVAWVSACRNGRGADAGLILCHCEIPVWPGEVRWARGHAARRARRRRTEKEGDRLGAYRLGTLILFGHHASKAGTSSRALPTLRVCCPSLLVDTDIEKVRHTRYLPCEVPTNACRI
jgi:hypothetical protein